MPIRGVLPGLPVLRFSACATASITNSGCTFLSSRSGTLYVGITEFFDQRIHQHQCDSIEGFTKKYQVHRLGLLRKLPGRASRHRPRKATQALAAGKKEPRDPRD